MTPVIPGSPDPPPTRSGDRAIEPDLEPAPERQAGEDHELVRRVVALDVAARIGFGVPGRLGIGEHVRIGIARPGPSPSG